jgi:hypothetical protein
MYLQSQVHEGDPMGPKRSVFSYKDLSSSSKCCRSPREEHSAFAVHGNQFPLLVFSNMTVRPQITADNPKGAE